MFRGYLSLDGTELVNSSRVVAHLAVETPTQDAEVWGTSTDCSLTITDGLAAIPASVVITDGLATPPDGSHRYDAGLVEVADCWTPNNLCGSCNLQVAYDDSWPGLRAWLSDNIYRPEMAPWYSTEVPESAEFGGVWLLKVDGFGPTPIERPVTELVGSGASAGPHRDASRKLTFTALLVACTNAGLTYGLEWLACQLRQTKDSTDATLRYLTAHPSDTAATPDDLLRELHSVVLTKAPTIDDQFLGGSKPYRQATQYQVSWEMTALHPYTYAPPVQVGVSWDSVTVTPVRWLHAADCKKPETCEAMPVLFSTDCEPEEVDIITDPPPSCGGCLPVCEVDTYVFTVPTTSYPLVCHETAATMTITNGVDAPLSLQAYWRVCSTQDVCEDNRFPLQIAGLPPGAALILDAITGRYWAALDGHLRRPVGIVSTPTGAPWRPPIIDRNLCWELVILAADGANFAVTLSLTDREA